jgi:Tol biopolymer transport system component
VVERRSGNRSRSDRSGLLRGARRFGKCDTDDDGGRPPRLTPLTAGAGLALDPAASRDGALIAYASDRAGGDDLDVWVQPAAAGTPIRVTHDSVDESEPAFSPDGGRIVFRSEREGGGLYLVPALGGQEPRLLVPQGRRPRFSPDGQSVAYWTGTNIGFSSAANSYRVFVVPASGGTPTPVTAFTGARFPVWSPDGQSLLVLGSRSEVPAAETYDWWLAPVHGGQPIRTNAYERMREAGVTITDTSAIWVRAIGTTRASCSPILITSGLSISTGAPDARPTFRA